MDVRFEKVRSRLTSPVPQRFPLIRRLCPVLFDDRVADWREAVLASTGYDNPIILRKVEATTKLVMRGEATFERDSVAFHGPDLNWPLIAGLQRAAIRNRGSLSVLDVGGSLGSSFLHCRAFLRDLESLEWRIVEQPSFAEAGRKIHGGSNPLFFQSMAEGLQEFTPHVVYFGSSLQYVENPSAWLKQATESGAGIMILDRIPVSDLLDPIVAVQHVPDHIYPASYPAWIFGDAPILKMLRPDWTVLAEFDALGGISWTQSGRKVEWRGWILERTRGDRDAD